MITHISNIAIYLQPIIFKYANELNITCFNFLDYQIGKHADLFKDKEIFFYSTDISNMKKEEKRKTIIFKYDDVNKFEFMKYLIKNHLNKILILSRMVFNKEELEICA